MQWIPYLIILTVTLLHYLNSTLGINSRQLSWTPEILSALTMAVVVVRAVATKSLALQPRYVIAFGLFCLTALAGIILNAVPEGAIFAGLRNYFKFVPLFLLPAVYDYSDRQIRTQLKLLLFLAFLQAPIAVYQRFITFANLRTGDGVTGTLGISSVLSIFLIGSIAIVLAFYLRNRISFGRAAGFMLLLLLPTTINETKGALVLIPIAFLIVLAFAGVAKELRKKIAMVVVLASVALTGFVFVYDYVYPPVGEGRGGLVDFFSSEQRLTHYLNRNAEIDPSEILRPGRAADLSMHAPVTEQGVASRMTVLGLPFRVLSEEPVKLILGLGIGNASTSFLPDFEGDYAHIGGSLGGGSLTLAILLWEVGLFGAVLFYIFLYLILDDARCIRNRKDIAGVFATGWGGVVALVAVALAYKNILVFDVLTYLFWFYSGYVAAKRFRVTRIASRFSQPRLSKMGPSVVRSTYNRSKA